MEMLNAGGKIWWKNYLKASHKNNIVSLLFSAQFYMYLLFYILIINSSSLEKLLQLVINNINDVYIIWKQTISHPRLKI